MADPIISLPFGDGFNMMCLFFFGGGYHVLRCSIFLGATISYHSATLRFHAVPRMARHCYCFSHGGLGLVEMPQLHVLLVRGGLDVCSQGLGGNQWQPGWVFRTTWNQNVVIDHLLKNMMFTQFHVGSTGPMRSARNMWGRYFRNCPSHQHELVLVWISGEVGGHREMLLYHDCLSRWVWWDEPPTNML